MALGDGDTWDQTVPTNATVATQIDDYNRDLRKGIRGRMAHEHEFPESQSATSEGGKHKFMTLQMQSVHPTLAGTQVGAVYQKTDGTGGDSFYFVNAATQEINLSRKLYFWYLEGAVESGANASATLVLVSDGKIYGAKAYVSTVAAGGDGIQVDILYNGSSIWSATSDQVLLAPGSTSTSVASFATTNVAEGGLLTIDLDKVGETTPGGNLTVMVEVG